MALTPREMEALSRRYNSVAIVVPLADGSYAVFSNDRTTESMLIVEDLDELSFAIASRANMHQRKTPSKGLPSARLDLAGLLEE